MCGIVWLRCHCLGHWCHTFWGRGHCVPHWGHIVWHRLGQPPASFFLASSFLTPTTTAPSALHCSWRPLSWPCRPLSPSSRQQAQQSPFAAPARSPRFRPVLIFAPADNGCYSRLPRLQPPPDPFPRSYPAFLMTPALTAGMRAGSSNRPMAYISSSV